jgi:hypothetical protein
MPDASGFATARLPNATRATRQAVLAIWCLVGSAQRGNKGKSGCTPKNPGLRAGLSERSSRGVASACF